METTDKISVQQLTQILWQKGVKHIVISPGSRNAPMILGFTAHSKYTCSSVPDERVAGFIALGIADETKAPVALVCSSGSALLNYYPAIAEAFYRNIPLVVLSADRPEYLIDQGDGQTIRQQNVFSNHILFSAQLREFPQNQKETWYNERLINDALNTATEKVISKSGPVHINLPFEEPLYNKVVPSEQKVLVTSPLSGEVILPPEQIELAGKLWNEASKIIILIGQMDFDSEWVSLIHQFSSASLILAETTSNTNIPHSIQTIDRLITPLSDAEKQELRPDLLITLGQNVVSKRIKAFLRDYTPKHHLAIETSTVLTDTYQCASHSITASPTSFFTQLVQRVTLSPKSWVNHWVEVNQHRAIAQNTYLPTVPFSDLKIMETICKAIPTGSIIHLANSATVRYAQLFSWNSDLIFKSNRGTSGIDGIFSTAVGNALATQKEVYLIIGDVSFFYDSNALWLSNIPANLKIVVVNNNGGGIFRLIDGPKNTGQLEPYFETHQKNSVKHIALAYGVDYFCATDETEFKLAFDTLKTNASTAILEVQTPQTENAEILKTYFKNVI